MDIKKFEKPSGKFVKNSEGFITFVPSPIPTKLNYDEDFVSMLSKADSNLGMLAGIGQLLPNPHLLINPYIRREAVLSSRIEGTMASLSDLFLYEIMKKGPEDYMRIREVRNYVSTTIMALGKLKRREKISVMLIKDMHRKLLHKVRGEDRSPGDFRHVQNWIGTPGPASGIKNAVFVPPTYEKVPKLLLDLENFIKNPPKNIPPLVQCALIHYQFETIHPFLDGNGRLGRLLITLFLCEKKLLPQPLLYLSAYLEKNKGEYVRRLQAVREKSDYIGWVKFFLDGVSTQSKEAIKNVQKIMKLQKKYHDSLRGVKSTITVVRLADGLFLNPYVTASNAAGYLHVSFPTAQSAIRTLEKVKILKKWSKRKRDAIYVANDLMRILD